MKKIVQERLRAVTRTRGGCLAWKPLFLVWGALRPDPTEGVRDQARPGINIAQVSVGA